MPASLWMRDAGIEVPEFRCPTTPTTAASTSFCAAAVPCFGSAASSSESNSKLTCLPPIVIFFAFGSSTASLAPRSLSLPRRAMPPVIGATWPILTTVCAATGALATAKAEASAIPDWPDARMPHRKGAMAKQGAMAKRSNVTIVPAGFIGASAPAARAAGVARCPAVLPNSAARTAG